MSCVDCCTLGTEPRSPGHAALTLVARGDGRDGHGTLSLLYRCVACGVRWKRQMSMQTLDSEWQAACTVPESVVGPVAGTFPVDLAVVAAARGAGRPMRSIGMP